jgi:hypothetical protein
MYVSGDNFRLTPEVSKVKLTFEGLTLYGTGVSEIGISGQSNRLSFVFSGNKITSPSKKFVGTYNTGEPFDFAWFVGDTSYYFALNNNVVAKAISKSSFNIQRFFVNTTGTVVSSDAKFYCDNIATNLTFDQNYYALSSLTGRLTNQSAYKFRIFDGKVFSYDSVATALSGSFSGDSTGNADFVFSYTDTNTSRFDNDISYLATLNTSIGQVSGIFNSNRVSGLDLVVSKLSTDIDDFNIQGLFDGSGISGNRFDFVPTPGTFLISYYATSTNLRGENQDKTVTIQLEPVSPTNSGTYNSLYVTGFSLASGGEYLSVPTIKVTGYYFVSGLDWPINTMLMSSGCSGNLTVTFSGVNNSGRNASGYLSMTRTLLSGTYGEGLVYYYLPQTFTMVSGGTGYLSQPKALLQTGAYANCYDVGAKYNTTYSIFRPFSGSGSIASQADYLTGLVLTRTGLVSGSGITGYIVTGIEFTNIGSGYTTGNLIPRVSFIRNVGDTLTANAVGSFTFKQTGQYFTTGHWSLQTGLSTFELTGMAGITGTGYLTELDNYFTVQINYSGLDNTQPIVSKLTVSMVGADTITHFISGIKSYDTSTGFLKKKNSLDLTIFNTGASLSFSLTQDDLDSYYSSDDYINTGATINVGDLDF